MSENIQSISQGTYTIGQSNNLTFEAGPGIKIDEPSAGTVRIGADETVLYSGSRTSACQISEPLSSFEKIEFYLDLGLDSRPKPIVCVHPNSVMMSMYPKGGGTSWFTWMYLSANDTNVIVNATKAFNFGAATATTWSNPSVSVNSDEDKNSITKIIGINRKEV